MAVYDRLVAGGALVAVGDGKLPPAGLNVPRQVLVVRDEGATLPRQRAQAPVEVSPVALAVSGHETRRRLWSLGPCSLERGDPAHWS